MSSIELTSSQRDILSALVDLHREREDSVKGETIAGEVGRNAGTIRNQMQSLKALQLVEGVPGPKGGYRPTTKAFEALDVQQMDDPASTPLALEGEHQESLNVQEIDLTSVHHPELCRAEVTAQGSIRHISDGDSVTVGPTPLSKLVIEGTVDGKEEAANTLVLKIDGMRAPAGESSH
ncbi:Rrf2 family transcriptional regulator [Halobaculum sp. MBLA0143]|uniref:Rrf2 family transcriptional regulator n=1 Tax=Halobaculum sp. MBLA0143 TaxID=3079933 RepID=UPI0035241660